MTPHEQHPGPAGERDRHARRTKSARAVVVTAGAAGALGAAVAIGLTTQTSDPVTTTTDLGRITPSDPGTGGVGGGQAQPRTSRGDDDERGDDRPARSRPAPPAVPQPGLVAPGGGGPPQARSSGS